MQDEQTPEEAPEEPTAPEPEGVEEEAPADDDVPPDPEPVPEAPVAEAQADGDPGPEIVCGPSPEDVNAQGPEPFNAPRRKTATEVSVLASRPSFAEHQAAKKAALRAQRNG